MKPVKKLTVSAILTALCVIALYIGSILPQVQLSLVALAALLPAVAVIHCGYVWAVSVYAVSGVIALLLLPDKSCAVWFLIVLGHYGVVKSLIERLNKPVLEWVCKVAVFAACIALIFLLFRAFFAGVLPDYSIWLLFAGLLGAFVLYDLAFSALISFYCRRIQPHVK